ncbi:MAG: CHASE2 domain-containing protein, partial [Hydrococcus sp. RM1_1_31]|nr:CHASE2 domain-containing protein [Hydrococcus sp. RM1_1_31]
LAEVSLSPLNFEPGSITRNQAKEVRILAILGDSTGIDVNADGYLLKNLPNAEIVFLVEPDRQKVTESLWDKQGWDILFFAGHSLTQEGGDRGQIYVNPNESLTIAQLKNALTEAIERGLQLAIFNSCDGLGLARQLADLYIPLTIVMREPVPDRVAQVFLKYFLSEFADGQSFDVAVRKARERLQGIEGEFPGASWLPVIFQNPAQIPPNWDELCQISASIPEIPFTPIKTKSLKISWRNAALASVACTLAVMGGRAMGIYQGWELKTFDSLLQLRSLVQSEEGRDERLLIVDITLADTEALGGEYPIADRTLLQLLQKLEDRKPLGVGIDMIRDRPVGEGWNDLIQYLKQNQKIIPPCSHPSRTSPGIVSPTGNTEGQSGFINVVADPDGIIRRHLLATDPPNQSPCSSYYALSTRLANLYLEAKGYKLNFPTTETWEFKHATSKPFSFQILNAFTGFYQQPDQTRGHQILLNYRAYNNSLNEIARRVTLTEVLQDKVDPSLIRDRLILIGITDPNLAKDEIRTPYNKEIRGLVLHAQMVSQILAAVADGRPLLRFMPLWGDAMWILTCALVAFVVLRRFPSAIGLASSVLLFWQFMALDLFSYCNLALLFPSFLLF